MQEQSLCAVADSLRFKPSHVCKTLLERDATTMIQNSDLRVLLYVSHPVLSEVTEFRLKLLGMHPVAVTSAEMMISEIEAAFPDAIIIDLDVDMGTGVAIVEKLASNEITSRIPILCVSAEADLPHVEEAFAAGASEFLIVPYDPIMLEDKMIAMVNAAEEERAIRERSEKRKQTSRRATAASA